MAIGSLTEELDAEIERQAQRRREIWAGAESTQGEVQKIAARLADLYEERRIKMAQLPGRERAEVIRRARVESELERLMSR